MGYKVKKGRKKRVLKKKAKYLFAFCIAIFIISAISLPLISGEASGNSEEIIKGNVNLSSEEVNKLSEIAKEKPNANLILNNMDSYPTELIKLACSNEETIDFVSNYTKHENSWFKRRISIKKDYNEGELPLFLQWDERWGYENYGSEFIAINGCGPTSLAMVAVGLTGNTKINPKVVADYSYNNGHLEDGVGSKWSLMDEGASYFGLQSSGVSKDETSIIETLKSNKPIIVSMGPGEFTSSGHFIVLNGIDSEGKIIVLDPNSIIRSSMSWDVDVFLREGKSFWSFSRI